MRLEESSSFWHWIVAVVLTPIALAISVLFGGWTVAMTTLAYVMVMDIVTGVVRSLIQRKGLDSSVSRAGVLKKGLIAVIVLLAWRLDLGIGAGSTLRDLTVSFFIASEALSVLENTVAAGLPVPQFLRNALARLDEKKATPGGSG